jgi:putative tricarboxylic transport membrane protein
MTDQASSESQKAFGLIKSTQEFGAGLFLIVVAGLAFSQAIELPHGSLRALGPGMLPQSLAVMVALGGVGLILTSIYVKGPALERWSIRGPFFIFGGIILFALLIRTCGLIVAGPVSMIFGTMASQEFNWKEATVFSLILTAVCILLFKTLLRLPIPVIGTALEPFFPF